MTRMRTYNDLIKLLSYAYWCTNGRPMPSWNRQDGWRESCRWPRINLR